MFPISTTNAEFTADDILAVSLLYPASNFLNGRGALRGTIRRRDGTLVRGANVIAINAANASEKYSTVTDYLGGSPGVFEFNGLPPGNYFVAAEPVVGIFNSGSSVGPYAKNRSDLSFIQPIVFEYYSGARESHDHLSDLPNDAVSVPVAANGLTENINFLVNDPPHQTLDQYFDASAASFLPIGNSQNYAAAAMRFTPNLSGKLLWIRLFINGGQDAIQGGGVMWFAILKPDAANSNLPGEVIDRIDVPLSSLTRGLLIPYELWVADRDIAATAGQDFFVSAEVIDNGQAQLLFDNGVTKPTFRTSVKSRSGAWVPTGEAFSKPHNLMMTAAIGGQPQPVVPLRFTLEQNFPNPLRTGKTSTNANAETSIRFVLPQDSRAQLSIFDMLGRQVRVFANLNGYAGYNVLFWNGRDANGAQLPSGIYFYRLVAGNFEQVRKLTLLH
jgi:hypothetical protein